MFGVQNFNEANPYDAKYAEKLLARHQQEQKKQQSQELKEMLAEEKNSGDQEAEALEQLMNENMKNEDVCKTYKLYNYVLQ